MQPASHAEQNVLQKVPDFDAGRFHFLTVFFSCLNCKRKSSVKWQHSAASLLTKTPDHLQGPSKVFQTSQHLGTLNVRYAFKVLGPLSQWAEAF